MKLKSIFISLYGLLLFGCSTIPDIEIDSSVSAEQIELSKKFSKEFGIDRIEEIRIGPQSLPSTSSYLFVRGDEQLKAGIGRYKELDIYLEEESFSLDPPRKITPTLYDCSMSFVEFVELEIENGKVRVLTNNIDPEFALELLTKIYNSDFILAPSVDAKDHPTKELMRKPDRLERRYGWNSVLYEFELKSNHEINFTVEEGNIVIQEYSWHIH